MTRDVETIAAGMSDSELYSHFSEEMFYSDPELTKAICQEIENREAALSGRKPAVITFDEIDSSGVSYGGQIIINSRFLKKNIKNCPADVLSIILHEGRHEWQKWMFENHPEDLPEAVRLMMGVDWACYMDYFTNVIDVGIENMEAQAWIEYSMQEIEVDARYYAVSKMREIASEYHLEETFQDTIAKAIDDELMNMAIVLEYMDEDQYQRLEELQKAIYEEISKLLPFYQELPEGFLCYGNIWMIRRIVYPAFEEITRSAEELSIIDDMIFYELFKMARIRLMNGMPLESPEQLLQIMLSDNCFKAEYKFRDQGMTKGIGKKIGMQ